MRVGQTNKSVFFFLSLFIPFFINRTGDKPHACELCHKRFDLALVGPTWNLTKICYLFREKKFSFKTTKSPRIDLKYNYKCLLKRKSGGHIHTVTWQTDVVVVRNQVAWRKPCWRLLLLFHLNLTARCCRDLAQQVFFFVSHPADGR